MGLKDLVRKQAPADASSENNDAAEAFISAAPVTTAPSARRKRSKTVYARTTFSLSKDINKQIDKISLYPRAFRVSRSDVVKAGVAALLAMDKADLLKLLEQVSKNEPVTDVMQDE